MACKCKPGECAIERAAERKKLKVIPHKSHSPSEAPSEASSGSEEYESEDSDP